VLNLSDTYNDIKSTFGKKKKKKPSGSGADGGQQDVSLLKQHQKMSSEE
jgi:hypothetical protein